MTETRTAQSIYPALRYRDAPAAIEWLERAFGFERQYVVDGEDGTIAHAQLVYDGSILMLGSERQEADDRYGQHAGEGWIYVVVDEPDALRDRAVAAGATIVQDLLDTDYGSRDFSVRDPEGNLWSFGTYRPEDPAVP